MAGKPRSMTVLAAGIGEPIERLMTAMHASPRIWLVLSDKLGDNAQVRIVADALGWPYEVRRLAMRSEYVLGKPAFRPSLFHLDRARSDPLEPPWPDLVLTAGRRCAMVALWIREQSGGRTRTVLIGRPKRRLDQFDLIIAPPQFHLPSAPHVIPLSLPLMRADPQRIREESARWQPRLAAMPRPLTAVLIGGETKPFRLDTEAAEQLLRGLERMLERDGGSLYLSTSRRTRPEVVALLRSSRPKGSELYEWSPDAGDNPYFALLGLADRFVVTGDSVSMMVEVARQGRPLAIYDLPLSRQLPVRLRYQLARAFAAGGVLGSVGSRLMRLGLMGVPRDLRGFHRRLYELGVAVPFGAPFHEPAPPIPDEVEKIASRVRQLAAA